VPFPSARNKERITRVTRVQAFNFPIGQFVARTEIENMFVVHKDKNIEARHFIRTNCAEADSEIGGRVHREILP
jgi:hypothetical protein